MRLGEIANGDQAEFGKPLDGVRVLALEQMQSLPWATQPDGPSRRRDLVKVEPLTGESGRGSRPAMIDPEGRAVGPPSCATTSASGPSASTSRPTRGRELILALAPRFDVLAENFKGGTMRRFGLHYEALADVVDPRLIYLSVSGFGADGQVALRRLAGVRTDRGSDVGHLDDFRRALGDLGTTRRPGRRPRRHRHRAVRRHRRARRASPPASTPASGSTSTWRCSTPWCRSPTSSPTSGRWAWSVATSGR